MKASDAVYVISVAARLVAMHPTTLRKYERVGFLEPSRTPGRTRLYSHRDIQRLRQIKHLVEAREVNLAGVEMALRLVEHLRAIEHAVETAPDVETARKALREPLQAAFNAVGIADERQPNSYPRSA